MSAVTRIPGGVSFGDFVAAAHAEGNLVVQPRMGMCEPMRMREGLLATKHAAAATVGTITLDSYTRVGDDDAARHAIDEGIDLNGYPIVAHDTNVTRAVLSGIQDETFPVQVRHGSARPQHIFGSLIEAGLDATEGGPVSYCLPYSRIPVRESVANWVECCEILAATRDLGANPHLETFGGCMLGQLCPPSLLVAISVLEALFFRQHGLRSMSLSYAQNTNQEQDEEALRALRRIAGELLSDVQWHIVVYGYMGLYPRSEEGADQLLDRAARLAVLGGAGRLIVKTVAEAHRIPTIEENVRALGVAEAAARETDTSAGDGLPQSEVEAEARTLVAAVLSLHDDIGRALTIAFRDGLLDVPYGLHPDNHGRSRSYIDGDGRLRWSAIGGMPLADHVETHNAKQLTSSDLIGSLSYVSQRFDRYAVESVRPYRIGTNGRLRSTYQEEIR
jgi:methylaspartate mutase epsilon subunit